MRVAAVQFEPGSDVEENVERMAGRVRDAAAAGADLVVLPEIWPVGYFAFDDYEAAAEPIDGSTVGRLRDLAADLGIHLHAGSFVERDGDDLHNTSALLGPDGDVLATYRKVHLFGYDSEERDLLTPGEVLGVAETPFGTVGLSTCYDLRFPELYRAMVDRGVEVFLVASAWPAVRTEHWLLLNRVRALENQSFLVAANLGGSHAGVELSGRSLVVDPWGTPIADASRGEGTVSAEIDPDGVESARESFPSLADRRRDLDFLN